MATPDFAKPSPQEIASHHEPANPQRSDITLQTAALRVTWFPEARWLIAWIQTNPHTPRAEMLLYKLPLYESLVAI